MEANLAMLKKIGPADMVQGMLAAQMIAIHSATMWCMADAARSRFHPGAREMSLRLTAKLFQAFAQQVAALNDSRREVKGRKWVRSPEARHGTGAMPRPPLADVV